MIEISEPSPVLPEVSTAFALEIVIVFPDASVAVEPTVISKVVAYPPLSLTAEIVEFPSVPVEVRLDIITFEVSTCSLNTMRIVSPVA